MGSYTFDQVGNKTLDEVGGYTFDTPYMPVTNQTQS